MEICGHFRRRKCAPTAGALACIITLITTDRRSLMSGWTVLICLKSGIRWRWHMTLVCGISGSSMSVIWNFRSIRSVSLWISHMIMRNGEAAGFMRRRIILRTGWNVNLVDGSMRRSRMQFIGSCSSIQKWIITASRKRCAQILIIRCTLGRQTKDKRKMKG